MDTWMPSPPPPLVRSKRRGWSWRGWAVLGAVVLLVVCAVPLGVLLVLTQDASEGAPTPDVAVLGAIGGLDRWNDDLEGAARYLASDEYEELSEKLTDIRVRLLADDPTYTVEAHGYDVVMTGDTATVTVGVSLRWEVPEPAGSALWMEGGSYPWTFRTELAHGFGSGWKVTGFDHPDLCTVYIRC